MKKILFVLLASLALFSCGDDDSGGSALKPTSVSIGGSNVTFTYDNKNRIASMNQGGTATSFTYNAKGKTDRLSSEDGFFQFNYDNNNRVSSIVDDEGETIVVTYSGNNTYLVDGQQLVYTSSGDIASFGALTLNYTNAKGAFANVKSVDPLALLLSGGEAVLFLSKRRASSVLSAGENLPFTYTEGEKGLPATLTVNANTITYSYSQ